MCLLHSTLPRMMSAAAKPRQHRKPLIPAQPSGEPFPARDGRTQAPPFGTLLPCPQPSPNVPSSPQTARPGSRGGTGVVRLVVASATHSLPPRDWHTLVVNSAIGQDAPQLRP